VLPPQHTQARAVPFIGEFLECDLIHDEKWTGIRLQLQDGLWQCRSVYAPFVQSDETLSTGSARSDDRSPSLRSIPERAEETGASGSIAYERKHAGMEYLFTDSQKAGTAWLSNIIDTLARQVQ